MDNFAGVANFVGNMAGLAVTYKVASDITGGIMKSAGKVPRMKSRASIWS